MRIQLEHSRKDVAQGVTVFEFQRVQLLLEVFLISVDSFPGVNQLGQQNRPQVEHIRLGPILNVGQSLSL